MDKEIVNNENKKEDQLEEPNTKGLERWIVFCIILAVIFVIAGFFSVYLFKYNSGEWAPLSEFGDYTGGSVSSLWSLAGLLIIFVAFLGQRKEIRLQQHEIKQSNLLFSAQEKQMKLQSETMKMQQFENGYFNLLNMFFEHSKHDKRQKIKNLEDQFANTSLPESAIQHLISSFKSCPQINDYDYIHHFFLNFFSLLDHIDASKIKSKIKKRYIVLSLSKLFKHELYLLAFYYFAYSDDSKYLYESSKFKKIAEKYQLLKQLETEYYKSVLDKTGFYQQKAYSK